MLGEAAAAQWIRLGRRAEKAETLEDDEMPRFVVVRMNPPGFSVHLGGFASGGVDAALRLEPFFCGRYCKDRVFALHRRNVVGKPKHSSSGFVGFTRF